MSYQLKVFIFLRSAPAMSKVYQVITDRIIELLKEGTVPWHQPWRSPQDFPKNLVSGKPYRGINSFLLSTAGYESPYWLTFKQAKEREGHVKKGEKGFPCIYWNTIEVEDKDTGETSTKGFLKYYTVFNVVQCENIEYPHIKPSEAVFEPITLCEKVISNMPNSPSIVHGENRASYIPSVDEVRMPRRESFLSPEYYYSVLFHELTHSTGHESRLDRNSITSPTTMKTNSYAREELVAEMGAAFLCGHTGLENKVIDKSASYIDSWLERLDDDSRLVVYSASQAQKAADYILGETDHIPGEEESQYSSGTSMYY